ncbi:hypothetical protein GALL_495150 [mine drainage metagenome]|uniref:Uncharacterized protein n=1 Tax=mine drainage metagenome TaxID=410659 RepID=A0A1J5PM87_9ZZZZ
MKIGITLGLTDFIHHPLNAYHAFKLDPMKLQGGIRIAGKFLAFARAVVGVPDNAVLIKTLDQHHPRARTQVAADGSHRHGVRFRNPGSDGFTQPLFKLLQGIGVRGFFVEFGALVTFAEFGNVLHGISIRDEKPGYHCQCNLVTNILRNHETQCDHSSRDAAHHRAQPAFAKCLSGAAGAGAATRTRCPAFGVCQRGPRFCRPAWP